MPLLATNLGATSPPGQGTASSASAADFIREVRAHGNRLAGSSTGELLALSQQLRREASERPAGVLALASRAFALVGEALQRTRGIKLYDVQLHAAQVLARAGVAEMQTGEGKTYACAPAAYCQALAGQGVHVATTNIYLATRDYEILKPAWNLLGLSAACLPERVPPDEKRKAYRCDIVYGTGYEFGFDFLRDCLAARSHGGRRAGDELLQRLAGSGGAPPIQRGLHFAIVDEIDHVLLDDATSPLVLSDQAGQGAPDARAHVAAHEMARRLQPHADFEIDAALNRIGLTEAGSEHIHRAEVAIPLAVLRRTWAEYVEQALRARYLLERDVHYVVSQGAIQIVDPGTGRIFADRTWRDGLQQAVEAKEGVEISAEKAPLAQITRQRFYRLYRGLAGATGTALGCEREFKQVYNLRAAAIPLRVSLRRALWPWRFFTCAAAKQAAILTSVRQLHSERRPVLVGTRSIAASECLAAVLRNEGLPVQVLNGTQHACEAEIVAQAGAVGAITIATNLAGRGTDIHLAPESRERGGLHVIVSEVHESSRLDRQLIGRCARQGDPGSAQTFVALDDSLVKRYGAWLPAAVRRYGCKEGEVFVDLRGKIENLQREAERAAYASRCALFRQDAARDSLFVERTLRR